MGGPITLVPDSDDGFPKGVPDQNQKGTLGRARVALSDGAGNNIGSTGDALNVASLSNLVPEAHDHLTITYRTSGNGIGEIDQVVYRTGGGAGSIVATLTLTYDANDDISTLART